MDQHEVKAKLVQRVSAWVDRVCADIKLLERWGSADMTLHISHEGTDDEAGVEVHHFEVMVQETVRTALEDDPPDIDPECPVGAEVGNHELGCPGCTCA